MIIYYLLSQTSITKSIELNTKLVRIVPVRELNTKQASMLAFIVYNKVCIVTIMASNVSGVTIVIDIDLLI